MSDIIRDTDKAWYEDKFGTTEEITEDNFYCPSENEYESVAGESEEDWDISVAKPGLWENIRKKKEREGKDYKPAKRGDKDRPDPDAYKEAQSAFRYENPKTGEVFTFERIGDYKKDGQKLIYKGKAAEYQGRKVKLGKPFLTPDGPKKRSVYVKNDKGNVVKVNFGDPNMTIKKSDPARRKSFRARHNCDTATDKTSPRYWSCKFWVLIPFIILMVI